MTSIRTDGLTKDFGELRAVDNINMDLPRGGVAGFVGPNGSGKSTTIRMLPCDLWDGPGQAGCDELISMASSCQAVDPQAKKYELDEHDPRGSNLSHQSTGPK